MASLWIVLAIVGLFAGPSLSPAEAQEAVVIESPEVSLSERTWTGHEREEKQGDRSKIAEASYREALADLANGRVGMAIDRVVSLEGDLSEDCALAVELDIAERLVEKDPEALPVQAFLRISVQQARYPIPYRAGNLFARERSSIAGLRQLSDLYIAASGQEEAPTLMAGMLTLMANDVAFPRSLRRLRAARNLFEEALELDPGHLAALHSLGFAFELLGRPGKAIPYIDRALALDSGNPRYRLQRAVLMVKSGDLERGERQLEELTAIGPTWVRDLATQELVRLLMADERVHEAEALLGRGRQELPPEKLSLQFAALLDLRWADSTETLKALPPVPPGDTEASSRWLYDLGPQEEIEALKQEVSAAVSMRLAALANALKHLPPRKKTPVACQ